MIEILDTQGQEEYAALRDQWIKDGEGFVLVYCITKRSSFEIIRRLHNQVVRVKTKQATEPRYPGAPPQLAPFAPIMLVGNNSDRVTEREVSRQEGYELAKELGCDFVEASAKSCINVEKVSLMFLVSFALF